MVRIIVDTSIFIEEIRKGSESLRKLTLLAEKGGVGLSVPVIVLGELLAGQSMDSVAAQKAMVLKLKGMEILDIDCGVAHKYGEIRRSGWASGNDAWIAACCLVYKARLVTLNKKHFVDVKGLKLYNLDK